MLRWDVHNHVVPPAALAVLDDRYPIAIDGNDLAADRVRFHLTPAYTDPAAKLQELEALGLDAAVLSIAPPLFCYETDAERGAALCSAVNGGLADHCSYAPERLRWLAHVPLQDPNSAVRVFERAVADGAVGVQIGTSVAGTPLDAADRAPFWAAVDEAEVPVMLHPAYNGPHQGLADFYLQNVIGNQLETTVATERLVCAGVLARHPHVRLLLVHAGGYVPWQLGRLRHARQVRPELADAPVDIESVLGRLVVDTITHDTAVLGALVDRMGPMSVALGTDLPFDMATPDPVEELLQAVGADVAEAIMRETGPRLFGLADSRT